MHKNTILVVDDLRTSIQILTYLLEDEYNVLHAMSGKEALQILEKKQVDLIILDILMPEMDGYEVCKQIQENILTTKIPIIFITELDSQDAEIDALSIGAVDFISKPFSNILVKARVKTHIVLQNEIRENRQKDIQLINQSRNAQMGEIINIIAHHWRQPLSVISSTLMDIQMKSELDHFDFSDKEEVEKYASYINNRLTRVSATVDTLSTTIDDFMSFYKPKQVKSLIKIETILNRVLSIVNYIFKDEGIEIIKEYDTKKELEVYENELMQAILNIVKNAQDNFLSKNIQNPCIKISLKDNCISIYDNGGGIPQDIILNIFNPYFSTKDEKNGTGLGLYMSKIIIEKYHDGRISVENVDDGSCFHIEL
ncbi:hybrid sensor histidine kinase/response regulator [Sulfurimonas sp.]|nr:hybrid sensor histidine kinase/response regulator [Sulfurimonas sp.]